MRCLGNCQVLTSIIFLSLTFDYRHGLCRQHGHQLWLLRLGPLQLLSGGVGTSKNQWEVVGCVFMIPPASVHAGQRQQYKPNSPKTQSYPNYLCSKAYVLPSIWTTCEGQITLFLKYDVVYHVRTSWKITTTWGGREPAQTDGCSDFLHVAIRSTHVLKTLLHIFFLHFYHCRVYTCKDFSTCSIKWLHLAHIQASALTWLYDYDMQLKSLWGVTGPGVDRGRQPVQQLAHMLSIELHHRVQALHLTQELHTLQRLKKRGGRWSKIKST